MRLPGKSQPVKVNSRDQVYESIGIGYAAARQPDPRIQQLVSTALADARSIVNVGASTGNYEPTTGAWSWLNRPLQ